MQMRLPATPLITVDPYFSVWCREVSKINRQTPVHWTGYPNNMTGTVTVDGEDFAFLGNTDATPLRVVSCDVEALTTTVVFDNDAITLTAKFTTPLLVEDCYYASRPVSYVHLAFAGKDGKPHTVTAKLWASEELVLSKAGEGRADSETVSVDGCTAIRMGNGEQNPLNCCGDDVRIDWGYLYLGVRGNATVGNKARKGLYGIYAETVLDNDALFLLGYDDGVSVEYFHRPLKAYWKKDGKTMEEALQEAAGEYETLLQRCDAFSDKLRKDALKKGSESYARLLLGSYRQVMNAHKEVVDENGEILYISKECFSGACAATVDVTYPSAPLYLLYNPELLKGMLRPVFRFAASPDWDWDFAPHDVGFYPLLNGQTYGLTTVTDVPEDGRHLPHGTQRSFCRFEMQMPVEECGNMIILAAAIGEKDGNYAFAKEHFAVLEQWEKYLEQYGEDPENQLCTDDFAGHLAHNCNLSLKAIMGIMGFARICRGLGDTKRADALEQKAKAYAESFLKRSANTDGSTRLAYDQPGTFSLKYNAVWDKIWKTDLFPDSFYAGEIARYKQELMPYGVPLDSRETYTKSDWMVWVACLVEKKEDFCAIVERVWASYEHTHDLVPMTDWYYADTAEWRGFQNRTVQGGLFIRLMME